VYGDPFSFYAHTGFSFSSNNHHTAGLVLSVTEACVHMVLEQKKLNSMRLCFKDARSVLLAPQKVNNTNTYVVDLYSWTSIFLYQQERISVSNI